MKIYKLKKDFDFGGSIIPLGTLFYFDNTKNWGNPECFYNAIVPIHSSNGHGFVVETNDKNYGDWSNNGIGWHDWFEYVEEKTALQIDNPSLTNDAVELYKWLWGQIVELKHLEKILSVTKESDEDSINGLKKQIEEQKIFIEEQKKVYEEFTMEKF